VVSRLVEFDAIARHSINQPMLLRDPAAPATRQLESKRFGFADATEMIVENGRHQIQDTESDLAVCFDPIAQIVSKIA